MGVSRPYWTEIWWIWAAVAFLPASRAAWLPVAASSRNVMIVTAIITNTAAMMRRMMNRIIAAARASTSAGDPHLRARVQRIADAVAEDVDRHHGQDEHQPGHEHVREPDRDRRDPLGDHRPPRGVRRLHAGAEVGERRLEQDRVGEDQRDEHDDRRGDVRQQLTEHDLEVRQAL